MKSLLILTLLSVVLVSGMGLAYADVSISAVLGSGAPGCEETADGCYTPTMVKANVGETIVFKNPDTAAHTFTSGHPGNGPSGEFDSGLIMVGDSYEYSPDTVGEIPYFCMVHPWMIGTIMVGSGGDINNDPIPPTLKDNSLEIENQQLKNEVRDLKLENRNLKIQNAQLSDEIESLKDQIISMSGEFVDMITQLNEWFRSQLS